MEMTPVMTPDNETAEAEELQPRTDVQDEGTNDSEVHDGANDGEHEVSQLFICKVMPSSSDFLKECIYVLRTEWVVYIW